MKARPLLAAVLSAALVCAASAAERVTYRVTVEDAWSAASHPHAGTDSGATFTSPDADTMPREAPRTSW